MSPIVLECERCLDIQGIARFTSPSSHTPQICKWTTTGVLRPSALSSVPYPMLLRQIKYIVLYYFEVMTYTPSHEAAGGFSR